MADWMGWLIVAGVLVILELFSGTFYLLMLAVGMAAGALAAFSGAGLEVQIVSAAVVGVAATAILHRSRFGWQSRTDTMRDPNVNLDIGQFVQIDAWNIARSPHARAAARVTYRGAPWDVELGEDARPDRLADAIVEAPPPGRYRIVAVRGSRLIVAAA
jgi:membrane protein implicated in regulation of membrane protease activity